MIMLLFKTIFLLLAVVYTYSNTAKLCWRRPVTEVGMWLQGIGITGFIVCQWLL